MTIYWQWGSINVSSYQSEFQEGFIENTPDAGIPFRRLRFTNIQKIFQGTFTLTPQEKLEFESWYKFDIKQGELSFQYYDCEEETYKTTKIIGKPAITANSNLFNVNIKLTFENEA